MLYSKIAVDLQPTDYRKSFYGKAQVIYSGDDLFLQSYDTIVCGIVAGKFEKYWPGYSATTMRHINSFINSFSHMADNITCQSGGKAFWESLDTVPAPIHPVTASYKINPVY